MGLWRGRGIRQVGPQCQLLQRSIVWAHIPSDTGGIPKRRRCIVLSPNADIGCGKPISIIGVTRGYDRHNPALFIPMLHADGGHPLTTFEEACAAKATWIRPFPEDQLKLSGGCLPVYEFNQLLAAIEAYAEMLRQGMV